MIPFYGPILQPIKATGDCASDPCHNGGRCVNNKGRFICECASHYVGATCEYDIHTCRSHPCLNGGTCRDGINAYLCSCTDDFTGSVCEQFLTGRSAHEEASSPSFDVVEAIKTCRWRWLGNYHVFVDITAVESDNRYGSSMAVCHLFLKFSLHVIRLC
ncbi:hypothetical protein LSAT2_025815 [Lamellibrachia satsuma]|nr:hypothetical protein LSAT2_025815 [Lamellibrachia satsuma]